MESARSVISCISVIEMKRIYRFIRVYGLISVLLIVIERIYAIYSHGVPSWSMSLMFTPVLLGGAVYLWIDAQVPSIHKSRAFYVWFTYTFHTFIALFVNRLLIEGILQIAGSDSSAMVIFDVALIFFLAVSLLFLLKTARYIAGYRK